MKIWEKTNYVQNYQFTKKQLMNKVEYRKLLKREEWRVKRIEILVRDSYACQKCKRDDIELHVHHLYYIEDNNPWEYPNSALLTLCKICHNKEHKKKPPVPKKKKKIKSKGKNKKNIIKLNSRDKKLQERYNKHKKR